MYAGFAEKMC